MPAKYLIVNADDYGLCREISTGILKACEYGIVTSVSVVSAGAFFKAGCGPLKASGLDVGLHLTFVDQERALTGPIRGLTDVNGVFLKNRSAIIPRIVLNAFDRTALKRELFAQADRLAQAGFNITHIDAHQHLHLLPHIADMVLEIAKHYHIRWIRIPQSSVWNVNGTGLNLLGRRLGRLSTRAGLRHTDHSLGFDSSGRTRPAVLLNLIDEIQPGLTEIIMHPGYDASRRYDWGFEWEKELSAVTSSAVKNRIRFLGIHLTNFSGAA